MILLRKTLIIIVFISLVAATTENKPDMQKVYDEAVNWSKTKLDKMPDTETSHETASIGVCRGASEGEPLMIKPPCSKRKKIDEVVDGVIDDDKVKNQAPKILVFVSFSMPKASLRALAQEVAKHNAVLVMRGLKGDSFKVTQKAFLEILTEGKNLDPKNIANQDMQGFEVNPELFKTYKITKVPVFVLIKKTSEISRLSGNVSLDFAAKKLKESL